MNDGSLKAGKVFNEDSEKITINNINLSVPTLDDVFLKKTGHSLRE